MLIRFSFCEFAVWRELQKENKDFFRAYYYNVMCHRPFMMSKLICHISCHEF